MAAELDHAPDEFVLTRTFDAPRRLVYQAWTDPRHLAKWWGPREFPVASCTTDLRVGGRYRWVMRGPEPDGTDYPITGEFLEIVPDQRLVFTMDCSEHPPAWHDMVKPDRRPDETNPAGIVLATVTFDEAAPNQTKLTIRQKFESAAIRDAMVNMGMNAGWSSSLDRLLEALIEADASVVADRLIVFSRVYDAPRELVFDAFVTPEMMSQWWGPDGFTTIIEHMDVRPGGSARYIMRGTDYHGGTRDYLNIVTYQEVRRPERLVFKHGGPDADEPVNHQTIITFETLPGGKTKLTMRLVLASAKAKRYVIENYHADEGGVQTLARLAEFLAAK